MPMQASGQSAARRRPHGVVVAPHGTGLVVSCMSVPHVWCACGRGEPSPGADVAGRAVRPARFLRGRVALWGTEYSSGATHGRGTRMSAIGERGGGGTRRERPWRGPRRRRARRRPADRPWARPLPQPYGPEGRLGPPPIDPSTPQLALTPRGRCDSAAQHGGAYTFSPLCGGLGVGRATAHS
jgi:hypothetical protein